MDKGRILIMSGPSGSGKSSIINYILSEVENSVLSISTTSREPREGEIDGMDYNFVEKSEFKEMIQNDKFLEYENVHGNFYGTELEFVEDAINFGKLLVFDVDTRGRESILKAFPDLTVTLFVTTPTKHILEERLRSRGTENEEQLQKRLKNATEEMKDLEKFDFLIINDDLDNAKDSAIHIAKMTLLKPSKDMSDELQKFWDM
ncbi:guanylate kinase [Thiovulum sp. ES]|nr:guanylate kinase [Thiovulum sp. ES]